MVRFSSRARARAKVLDRNAVPGLTTYVKFSCLAKLWQPIIIIFYLKNIKIIINIPIGILYKSLQNLGKGSIICNYLFSSFSIH